MKTSRSQANTLQPLMLKYRNQKYCLNRIDRLLTQNLILFFLTELNFSICFYCGKK